MGWRRSIDSRKTSRVQRSGGRRRRTGAMRHTADVTSPAAGTGPPLRSAAAGRGDAGHHSTNRLSAERMHYTLILKIARRNHHRHFRIARRDGVPDKKSNDER